MTSKPTVTRKPRVPIDAKIKAELAAAPAAKPKMTPRQVMFSDRQREIIEAAVTTLQGSGAFPRASAADIIREGAIRFAQAIAGGEQPVSFVTYSEAGR